MIARRVNLVIGIAIAGWIAAVTLGFAAMHRYELTAGAAGVRGDRWPAQSRIPFDSTRPNLVMLAHPRCPCTRASLEEIAALVAQFKDAVTCHVVFFRPAGSDEAWTESALHHRATAIPGVHVHDDVDAEEAARFGVETSGHLLVYDPSGRLVYSGGITGGRGRYGNNVGRLAVTAILQGELSSRDAEGSPIYGCALFEPGRGDSARRTCDATQQ